VTVLLALLAAASYGLSDFNGGWVSKRVSAWTVALAAQAGGVLATLVIALPSSARPSGADLAWAVLAGLGNGFGTAFLYRGLSSGRMGVVAPVSGVGAAFLPVVTGVLIGERPGPVVWLGIALAFPAIWVVAREPASADAAEPTGLRESGLVDGVLAGIGFGTLFVALSRVSEDAGLLPLAVNQAVGGVVIVAVAVALRQPWLPREGRAALGLGSGVLAALATWLFMVASRGSHLTVASVVVSLYPAFTVLLAALLLRERVHRAQGIGLVLCGVSVALVAAG
jgi:drug/metabolite transporter (DMT)-like permease